LVVKYKNIAAKPHGKKEIRTTESRGRLGAGGGISELFKGSALCPPLAPSRLLTAQLLRFWGREKN